MSAKAAEFFTYIAMSALDAAWSSKPAEPAIPSDAAISQNRGGAREDHRRRR